MLGKIEGAKEYLSEMVIRVGTEGFGDVQKEVSIVKEIESHISTWENVTAPYFLERSNT